MKNIRPNTVRLALLAFFATFAGALTACTSDGRTTEASWSPMATSNGTVDQRSSTSGPNGDSNDQFNNGNNNGHNGSWWDR